MLPIVPPKAVIYCRVSGARQVREGDGLASQETRCREYASHRGYEVQEVFRDDVSGGHTDRPAMIAMLKFLKRHRNQGYVVVIDDITRFARDIRGHWDLRDLLREAGGKLESPTLQFSDDPDSILVENLLASVSQHHRQKNAEQTKNRMRARSMNGYWVFQAPVGYRYERVAGHGKLLVRDEPIASIVQEALESFASGRLATLGEVKRFLEAQPAYPRDRKGEVHVTRVEELLSRPIYAGYISLPDWNLHLVPGKHQPLISLETWQQVQDRRHGVAKVPARKDLNQDFPLRGFILCGHCQKPLTACWSKGRNALYPYYLCDTQGCASYRKSIRREVIEGEFEQLLETLQPTRELFGLAFAMFRDLWDDRLNAAQANTATLRHELTTVERKMAQFLDRIIETESRTLITAYEGRIRELEQEKALIAEKIGRCGRPVARFDETYRTAFRFLASPCDLWASDRLEDKRAVLKLVFAERLPYLRGEGYRTAETSLPFKALEDIRTGKLEMVEPNGIEPSTS